MRGQRGGTQAHQSAIRDQCFFPIFGGIEKYDVRYFYGNAFTSMFV